MKCRNCRKLYKEHGCLSLACPIYTKDGIKVGFSSTAFYEAEGKDWQRGIAESMRHLAASST